VTVNWLVAAGETVTPRRSLPVFVIEPSFATILGLSTL